MDTRTVIRSQFYASLDMLEAAIRACPETVWDRAQDVNRTWLVAYHTLFYVHLYLQPTRGDFVPREGHQDSYAHMGTTEPSDSDGDGDGDSDGVSQSAAGAPPLSKELMLDYLDWCRGEVDRRTAEVDLDASSGFYWLPMTKLELQFYSVRHAMQHVGEMYERLSAAGVLDDELPWIGMGPS
jgi:hypothetical protein